MLKILRAISLIIVLSVISANTLYAGLISGNERYVDNTLYSGTGSASGTATGGGNDYILLAGDASTNDDDYNNYGISILSGTGANQHKRIIDYDATGHGSGEKYAQVDSAWSTNPDNTSVYEITVGSDSNNGKAEGLFGGTNGAHATIDDAIDSRDGDVRIHVLVGREYDLLATITYDYDADGVLQYLGGYTSTPFDGGTLVIDAQSSVADCIQPDRNGLWCGIELKNPTDDGIDSNDSNSDGNRFYRLYIHNTGGDGFEGTGTANPWHVIECEVTATGETALDMGGSSGNILYNYVHDITTYDGIEIGSSDGGTCAFNIVDTIGDDGIVSTSTFPIAIHNTIYNCGDENFIVGSGGGILLNNIFHTAGGWNVDGNSSVLVFGYNSFYAGTLGTEDNITYYFDKGNDQTGDPDFVDAAGADFDLNTSTTIDDGGFPPTGGWPGSPPTGGSTEMGVSPYEETGGGGTTIYDSTLYDSTIY